MSETSTQSSDPTPSKPTEKRANVKNIHDNDPVVAGQANGVRQTQNKDLNQPATDQGAPSPVKGV